MAARDLVEQQRAEQLLRDAKLAAELARQYGPAWERMRTEILQILAVVEKARAAGETVDTRWLLRKGYLDRLEKLVTFQTRTFLDFTARKVQESSVQAALDGQRDAAELVAEAAPGDVPKPLLETSYAVNNLAAGKPLRHLLDTLPGQVGSQAAGALLEGVVLGLGPREIARDIRKVATIPLTRALLISRTETLRVYRQAAFDRYRQSADVLTGWVWLAKLDDRTCPVCIALHGTRHELSEEMATHPNCFPAGTLVAGPTATAATKRWYSGELVDIETESGVKLSVTPNHPLLTSEGWIPAGLLNESHNLVRDAASERMGSPVNPDHQHVPALIEEVFDSLRQTPLVVTVTMPTSPEDFHGDGMHGQVDVVWANGLLRDGLQADLLKPAGEQHFGGADMGLPELTGASAIAQRIPSNLLAPDSVVGGGSVGAVLLGRPCGHHQTVGSDGISDLYSEFNQTPAHHATGYPEIISDGLLGFAGSVTAGDRGFVYRDATISPASQVSLAATSDRIPEVAQDKLAFEPVLGDVEASGAAFAALAGNVRLDRVLKVLRRRWSGHVYNLESSERWYTANGIVAHNCRCSMAPLTEPWTDPDLPDTRFAPQTGEAWFKNLSPERQRSILGPGKHDLYLDGQLKLADLVQPTTHILWGKGVRERALRDLPVRSV